MLSVVLVCGDRNWTNKEKIKETLKKHPASLIIHGGCRGADRLACLDGYVHGRKPVQLCP